MCMACVYVYAVVFDWYLIRMSIRSGVLCPLDGMCVVLVLLGASREECAGDGWDGYRLC